MHAHPASEFLGLGDALRERAIRHGEPVAAMATDADLSVQVAAKAHWLAGIYGERERRQIGTAELAKLTASHLEIVARCPSRTRVELLRRAAREKLSSRHLKQMIPRDSGAAGATVLGATNDLDSAARALETYRRFDEDGLRRLLGGPNGRLIRKLALAGERLAARIEQQAL